MLASTANYLKAYGWQRGQPWTEGTANYEVLREWNKGEVYSHRSARLVSRRAGG